MPGRGRNCLKQSLQAVMALSTIAQDKQFKEALHMLELKIHHFDDSKIAYTASMHLPASSKELSAGL